MAITVFVMWLLGQTFNLMTLGAMAIAIGLVIDDAVVITENIVRHVHLKPIARSRFATRVQELIWPVTTSTITTVVVFLPLGLLDRRGGPVLPGAVDHAHDRRARVARRRADDHSAAERAVPRDGRRRGRRRPPRRSRGLLGRIGACDRFAVESLRACTGRVASGTRAGWCSSPWC